MARLMAAPVTPLVFVTMASSSGLRLAAPARRSLRCRLLGLLRLRLLGGMAQHGVGVVPEGGEIDLAAVKHRAPVPYDPRHGHSLLDLLVGRAVRLGGGGMEIDAVLARNLRRHRKPDQLLGLAVEPRIWIELEALHLGPG